MFPYDILGHEYYGMTDVYPYPETGPLSFQQTY